MNKTYHQANSAGPRTIKDLPAGWILIGLLAFLAFYSTAAGGRVSKIESVGFTVSDMDRAIDFYTRVLPFEVVSDREVWGAEFEHLSGVFGARARVVRMRLGNETLELTEFLTPQGRPVPIDSRSNDRWFQHIAIIVSDMERAYRILRENKVRYASTAPQRLPETIPAAAGIKAFYFKDFDDHVLEILEFPAGKGAPKWHEPAKDKTRLFLGIDHTAIVVGDTAESLKFYRDALGLQIAGTSENFGTEQEHLNNVFGARLFITALRTPDEGIAVEFLEYLAPRDGRPFPKDSRSSDLWHWQTGFESAETKGLAAVLRQQKYDFISTGVVEPASDGYGFRRALVVRDADGHAVRVMEK